LSKAVFLTDEEVDELHEEYGTKEKSCADDVLAKRLA